MTLKLLCIHGVGHGEADVNLKSSWTEAVIASLQHWDAGIEVEVDFLSYDDLFAHAPLNLITYSKAMAEALASGVYHAIGDLFTRQRGIFDFPAVVRWTAGMVAQWISEPELRGKANARLSAAMGAKSYDAVLAHSLGSLIAYDAFRQQPKLIEGKYFLSFGSQIGNPCVRDTFAGRLAPLSAAFWRHLYNRHDHVLTAHVKMEAPNFGETLAEFDKPGDVLNHDATLYLRHPNALNTFWREVAGVRTSRNLAAAVKSFNVLSEKPRRRALLVGINDYPDPDARLEGCVNDVFLMSAALQESTFEPEEIRVLLNERATAAAMLERLHWLLDDVKDGDERMLFFSGHGAQVPAYGIADEPDHFNECLVPYDFDWSPERSFMDKQFRAFYSQLPYESHFVAIFDCCHAGGMTRAGGSRVRGLTPPDDIRHRALKWNAEMGMWEQRDFATPNPELADSRKGKLYLGASGANHRLGRAVAFRSQTSAAYDATRKLYKHEGPYMPVLLEACQESQLSYEYRHGVTSYGAFTFTLVETLRASRLKGRNMSFVELKNETARRLAAMGYAQVPELIGPNFRLNAPLPWTRAGAAKPSRKTAKKPGRKTAAKSAGKAAKRQSRRKTAKAR